MLLLALLGIVFAADPDGAALYRERCAVCHDGSGATRAPAALALKMMTPENIIRALETGLMKEQGASLSLAQKRTVAEFLSGNISNAKVPAMACADSKEPFSPGESDWNG